MAEGIRQEQKNMIVAGPHRIKFVGDVLCWGDGKPVKCDWPKCEDAQITDGQGYVAALPFLIVHMRHISMVKVEMPA